MISQFCQQTACAGDRIVQRTPVSIRIGTTKGWKQRARKTRKGDEKKESLISLLLFMMQKEARARECLFHLVICLARSRSIHPSIHISPRVRGPWEPPRAPTLLHKRSALRHIRVYTSPRPSQNTRHLTLSYYGFTPLYAAESETEVFGGEVAPGGRFMRWLGFVWLFQLGFYNLLCALKMGRANSQSASA